MQKRKKKMIHTISLKMLQVEDEQTIFLETLLVWEMSPIDKMIKKRNPLIPPIELRFHGALGLHTL